MKTILIGSLEHLYDLLVNNEDIIYKDGRMAIIKDYLDAAYTGCSCQRKNNEGKAFEIVKSLKDTINQTVLKELKDKNQAEKIIFQFENVLSFEL